MPNLYDQYIYPSINEYNLDPLGRNFEKKKETSDSKRIRAIYLNSKLRRHELDSSKLYLRKFQYPETEKIIIDKEEDIKPILKAVSTEHMHAITDDIESVTEEVENVIELDHESEIDIDENFRSFSYENDIELLKNFHNFNFVLSPDIAAATKEARDTLDEILEQVYEISCRNSTRNSDDNSKTNALSSTSKSISEYTNQTLSQNRKRRICTGNIAEISDIPDLIFMECVNRTCPIKHSKEMIHSKSVGIGNKCNKVVSVRPCYNKKVQVQMLSQPFPNMKTTESSIQTYIDEFISSTKHAVETNISALIAGIMQDYLLSVLHSIKSKYSHSQHDANHLVNEILDEIDKVSKCSIFLDKNDKTKKISNSVRRNVIFRNSKVQVGKCFCSNENVTITKDLRENLRVPNYLDGFINKIESFVEDKLTSFQELVIIFDECMRKIFAAIETKSEKQIQQGEIRISRIEQYIAELDYEDYLNNADILETMLNDILCDYGKNHIDDPSKTKSISYIDSSLKINNNWRETESSLNNDTSLNIIDNHNNTNLSKGLDFNKFSTFDHNNYLKVGISANKTCIISLNNNNKRISVEKINRGGRETSEVKKYCFDGNCELFDESIINAATHNRHQDIAIRTRNNVISVKGLSKDILILLQGNGDFTQ